MSERAQDADDADATVVLPTPGRKRTSAFAPSLERAAAGADLSALGGLNPLIEAANPILAAVPQIRHALRHSGSGRPARATAGADRRLRAQRARRADPRPARTRGALRAVRAARRFGRGHPVGPRLGRVRAAGRNASRRKRRAILRKAGSAA